MANTEYEAFAFLVASLESARDAATTLGRLRLDQRLGWELVSRNFDQMLREIYILADLGNIAIGPRTGWRKPQ